MAEQRHYTREEANVLLPEVRRRLEHLQEAADAMEKVNQRLQKASESNGSRRTGAESNRAAEALAGLLSWFEERGIIVRDIAQGLIDFPSIRDGEEILLCWKQPEAAVDFWHHPDSGFAGRQPL